MIFLTAALLGIVLGALATISHAALFPLGLVIALVGTFAGVRLMINLSGSRLVGLVAAIGWLAVVIRAAVPGGSGELLIWGGSSSTLFMAGGVAAVIVAVLLEPARGKS